MSVIDVIIVGGSLAGLMHGVMLKKLGHNVRIFEQHETGERSDFGAGIGTGPQGKAFLQHYDTVAKSIAWDCAGIGFLDADNTPIGFMPSPLYLTSWTALYYRLRALFDGLESAYVPQAPKPQQGEGLSVFHPGYRVVDVSCPPSESSVVVTVDHVGSTVSPSVHTADLVLDAGGPYSTIRRSLIPGALPSYTGYVAWRGVVPETIVSDATRSLFDQKSQFHTVPGGGDYCMCYLIPGESGSLEPGKRSLNWIWYSVVPEHSNKLRAILTDIDGHTHAHSVTRGKVDTGEWQRSRDAIAPKLCPAFRELMALTTEPFVSAIQESFVPRRSFHNGRVLLVGDGSNLMRPNGGQAMNHSATQCLALRDALQKKNSITEWEIETKNEGWRMRLFSLMMSYRLLYGERWGIYVAWRMKLFLYWLQLRGWFKRSFKL